MYYYDDDGSEEKREGEGEREFISNYNEEKKMAITGPGVLTSCSGSDNFRNENKIIINKNVHPEFERN